MSDSMIEKVARALEPLPFARMDAGWPGAWGNWHAAVNKESDLKRISKARKNARTAIAALREPTEAMLAAGCSAEGDGNLATDSRNIYRAMIGAILAEQP